MPDGIMLVIAHESGVIYENQCGVLATELASQFMRVDRTKLGESMEARSYVTLDTPAGDFSSGAAANELRSPTPFHLFGFGKSKGVLTWPNSD